SLITLFFFQAEDGIRDGHVTGVQTCALPISGLGARIVPTAPFALALPDLRIVVHRAVDGAPPPEAARAAERAGELLRRLHAAPEIGRASCRERVEISVGGGYRKNKKEDDADT